VAFRAALHAAGAAARAGTTHSLTATLHTHSRRDGARAQQTTRSSSPGLFALHMSRLSLSLSLSLSLPPSKSSIRRLQSCAGPDSSTSTPAPMVARLVAHAKMMLSRHGPQAALPAGEISVTLETVDMPPPLPLPMALCAEPPSSIGVNEKEDRSPLVSGSSPPTNSW